MYVFDNLGMCHNAHGVAEGFICMGQSIKGENSKNKKKALDLSASEILIFVLIAKQLLEAKVIKHSKSYNTEK